VSSSVGPTQCLRRCRRIVNRIPRPDAVSPHRFSTLPSIQPSTLPSTQSSTQRSTLPSIQTIDSTLDATLDATLDSTIRLSTRYNHRCCTRPCTRPCTRRYPRCCPRFRTQYSLPHQKKVPHLCRFTIGAPLYPGFRWAVRCHGSDEAGRVAPPVYYVRREGRLPRVSNTAGDSQLSRLGRKKQVGGVEQA